MEWRLPIAVVLAASLLYVLHHLIHGLLGRRGTSKARRQSILDRWQHLGLFQQLRQAFIDAGMDLAQLPVVLMLALSAALLIAYYVGRFTGNNWLVGILISPLGMMLIWDGFVHVASRRRAVYDEQVVSLIESMSYMLSIHNNVVTALTEYAQKAEQPIASDLHQLLVEYHEGEHSMGDLLEAWGRHKQNHALLLFASAVQIHEESGGPVEDVIYQANEAIRDQKILDMERRSETAGQSLMVTLLTWASLLFYVFLKVTMPDLVKPLETTAVGRFVMVFVAMSQLVIAYYTRRMTKGVQG